MDTDLQRLFLERWERYFLGSELPIAFFYQDDPGDARIVAPSNGHHCIICNLSHVRAGQNLAFEEGSVTCGGGKRYLGFSDTIPPDFEYFLSHGIPGELEGERYIRTPEMVSEMMKKVRRLHSGSKFIVFKRWDNLSPEDNPVVVIFFAPPEVLSGLFTLANYDQVMGEGVYTPFGSGCGTIVHQPFFENERENPRAILGMFDVSARPCVPFDTLTFAVPFRKFVKMISYMDESFLITQAWQKVMKRLNPVPINT